MAEWHHMMTYIGVNSGSGNGLVPDSTKSLPEPVLINLQWSLVAFTWQHFHKKWSRYLCLIRVWKCPIQDYSHLSLGPMRWLPLQSRVIQWKPIIPWSNKPGYYKQHSMTMTAHHKPLKWQMILYVLPSVMMILSMVIWRVRARKMC